MKSEVKTSTSRGKPAPGGGSFSDPNSQWPAIYGSMGLTELIGKLRETGPKRNDWEIGTPGGVIRGAIQCYAMTAEGEITLAVETMDHGPNGSASLCLVPVTQVSYAKLFP